MNFVNLTQMLEVEREVHVNGQNKFLKTAVPVSSIDYVTAEDPFRVGDGCTITTKSGAKLKCNVTYAELKGMMVTPPVRKNFPPLPIERAFADIK